jgi:hypothetical protein
MFKPAQSVECKRNGGTGPIESVPDILERELEAVIKDWLSRAEQEPDLTFIPPGSTATSSVKAES